MKGKEVKFQKEVDQVLVPAYSSLYGIHPSRVVPTSRARLKVVSPNSDPYTGKSKKIIAHRREQTYSKERLQSLCHARAEILSSTLKHGAAWERESKPQLSLSEMLSTVTTESMRQKVLRRWLFDNPMGDLPPVTAVRTPSAQSKHQKRQGARAVRKIEHAANEASQLTPEGATSYRALSARCNYLAQDRPDIAYTAK